MMSRRISPACADDFHAVLWPRGRRVVKRLPLARRLATLEGKTIALLWNSVFRGDEIFPLLEVELTRRFPGVRFVPWNAFGSIFGGPEQRTIGELPDRLSRFRVEAVVSAVGC